MSLSKCDENSYWNSILFFYQKEHLKVLESVWEKICAVKGDKMVADDKDGETKQLLEKKY